MNISEILRTYWNFPKVVWRSAVFEDFITIVVYSVNYLSGTEERFGETSILDLYGNWFQPYKTM